MAVSAEMVEVRVLPTATITYQYDSWTSSVTIDGTDQSDSVRLKLDQRGTSDVQDDLLEISVTTGAEVSTKFVYMMKQPNQNVVFNDQVLILDTLFDAQTSNSTILGGQQGLQRVIFMGNFGDDRFENDTNLSSTVYGGEGADVLIGGWASDSLFGDNGLNYIDGRMGDDVLWGGADQDIIYGDGGDDGIHGSGGNDLVYGGDGIDNVWGDDGNDVLDGGAGRDRALYGGQGFDRFFDDSAGYTNHDFRSGEDTRSTIHAAGAWFDMNLQDPRVRSDARLYYRDGSMSRTDMLTVYSTVGMDQTVTTEEFNDLKDLTSTSVVMLASTRSLSTKLAVGDRANQWFQGTALGNLAAGSTSQHLNKLVDKWFRGADHPETDAGVWYTMSQENLFRDGASYTDVRQGGVGDCYFLAALAAVAKQNPNFIPTMFEDNGDGTFSVRFYRNGCAEYVTVDRALPVDSKGWFYDHPQGDLWVALAEKAYVQINESDWIGQDGCNRYCGISGGRPEEAFKHILGRSASRSILAPPKFGPFSADQLSLQSFTRMIQAFQSGKAVTLCTRNSTASNIVGNHCYALIGYDATTKEVILRNPWGHADGSKPAEVRLTRTQLNVSFDEWISVVV